MNAQSLAAKVPFWAVHPLLRDRVSGFFLHDVVDSPPATIRHLYRPPTIAEFREILGFLAKRFSFVTLDQVVAHYREGDPLPKHAAYFSVDDGSASCRHAIAPMLKDAGIPATFFLTTRALNNGALFAAHKRSLIIDKLIRSEDKKRCIVFLDPGSGKAERHPVGEVLRTMRDFPTHTDQGKASLDHLGESLQIDWRTYLDANRPFMDDNDVRWLLGQGFDIGAHGVDHTKFQFLDEEARAAQVQESTEVLCGRFGVKHVAFSFPNSAAKVGRDWMRRQLDDNPRISVFVNTGKYQPNDSVLVNRINLDLSIARASGGEVPGQASTALAIKSAMAREVLRR